MPVPQRCGVMDLRLGTAVVTGVAVICLYSEPQQYLVLLLFAPIVSFLVVVNVEVIKCRDASSTARQAHRCVYTTQKRRGGKL